MSFPNRKKKKTNYITFFLNAGNLFASAVHATRKKTSFLFFIDNKIKQAIQYVVD